MPLNTRTFSDLDLNFSANPITGDIIPIKGSDAVIQSIKNLLLTNFYEFPFSPDVGSNVRRMLFENITPLNTGLIKRQIKEVIQNFEPRVIISDIAVEALYASNGYNVTITFFLVNISDPITVKLFLEKVR